MLVCCPQLSSETESLMMPVPFLPSRIFNFLSEKPSELFHLLLLQCLHYICTQLFQTAHSAVLLVQTVVSVVV